MAHTCVVVVAACSNADVRMPLSECRCQNADVKMPMSGQLPVCTCCPFSDSLRLAPGSPSSIMTSSRCSNLHNIFLILTAVDCGNLTDPVNGSVNHTTGTSLGQTATYSCDPGYNLVGDSPRTCQATGNWSGSAPTCQGVCVYELINPFLSNGDEIGIV